MMRLMARPVALALLLCAPTASGGIEYKFRGRELPMDVDLWSHLMVGHWLSAVQKREWHAKIAARLELSGAALLTKAEDGTLEAFFSQGGSTVQFDRGMGQQGMALPKAPTSGAAAQADLAAIVDGIQALQRACAADSRCGAASTARRAGRALLAIDWGSSELRTMAESMLWGELIGDAIGMPTMWFYSPPKDVIGAFGREGVTGFAPPPELHPTNTLMADFYANNREHVREVVGSVILHGKQELWQKKNVHYHAGLRAGENTLNAQLLRVLLRASSGGDGYSPRSWLEAYAKFMTTEGSHNDSYADTAHVQFFYRFSQGTPLEECGGDENHSTANIGALYALVVLLLASAPGAAAGVEAGGEGAAAAEQVLAAVRGHVALTHRSPKLARYASLLATLLLELLSGTPLRTALRTAGAELGIDLPAVAAIAPPADGQLPPAFSDLPVMVSHGRLQTTVLAGLRLHTVGAALSQAKGFGLSCYVHDSLPAVLYLAYKYAEPSQASQALLANTNVGGNTVHRGAILGAILGAVSLHPSAGLAMPTTER